MQEGCRRVYLTIKSYLSSTILDLQKSYHKNYYFFEKRRCIGCSLYEISTIV